MQRTTCGFMLLGLDQLLFYFKEFENKSYIQITDNASR
jgi:hypothetical protein